MTSEFYKDSEIFMTGGSGVVGKAAIEKLLRSCDVKKIYILLRCKKGASPQDRLEDMKKSRIFNVLKDRKPNELNKLVAVSGDTALDGLGISPDDREMIKNVSVFFHSAATTRFDEPLRTAIRLNLKSTLEALQIAETLKNLKIFIHVSTFFSNPYLKHIQDKVYPAVFDWRAAINLLDPKYDEAETMLTGITDKVITGFPNTYLFTKHLAEQLVNEYRHKLPVGIFRPSIVVAAVEEPEPGYTETMTGVMGLILIWGTGLIKVLSCRKDVKVDITPLDIGTKTLLAFTARTAQLQRERFNEATPVGMFSSDVINRFKFGDLGKSLSKIVFEMPYEKSFWIPGLKMTVCPFIYTLNNFFLQLLPAFIIDIVLRIFRRKPFMMQIQRKIFVTVQVLGFFIRNEYRSDGITDFQELLITEKGTEFDIGYIEKCCEDFDSLTNTISVVYSGCRKYLLNEDESSLPRCRQILKAKIIAYNAIRVYVLYIIGCSIYPRIMAYISQWN